ncbi:ATP-binding protein [Cloacibacillus sp. An23]|uniref:ATP-binding protein n=1 Tax=Cloacibacillus sp. An23 TaxID=1965591 RepID=UPI000B398683|nr:ATP-binding protein [Cloacibacillus sp. An23]OUO94843.1 hypothetical protein B5F39_02955 [Cloacibacillus sp. An23]
MEEHTLIPTVKPSQEFIEIALDFANPLDLVREAISNAFDAGADRIKLGFDVIREHGDDVFKIIIEDNGSGMDFDDLQSFFDLGNSTRKHEKDKNPHSCAFIGEKGHGTKIYFNSDNIEIETLKQTSDTNKIYRATLSNPRRELYDGNIPKVTVTEEITASSEHYTKIIIKGYNGNKADKFTHDRLRDYILWFTKMGSIEKELGILTNKDVKLELKGIDWDARKSGYDVIEFGHVFPPESTNSKSLLKSYTLDAAKHYCKKVIVVNDYLNGQAGHIAIQAVFYIEGNNVKYKYNPMIRRKKLRPKPGAYTVQERYGLWICKDYIPVQRKNEWIVEKGSEFTKFHAFINCQALKLTANRGSIENTESYILEALREKAWEIYDKVYHETALPDLDMLDTEINAIYTTEKEIRDFDRRTKYIDKSKIADYKGIRLVEPRQEIGVYTLFMQLSQIEPNLFPFTILDYDTKSGIDAIVVDNADLNKPLKECYKSYVEFKNLLDKRFNHSFEKLNSIICWDLAKKKSDDTLHDGDEVLDITQDNAKKRILRVVKPSEDNRLDHTRYFLDNETLPRKIEVFVLKTYLKEKLGIEFRPRTMKECY